MKNNKWNKLEAFNARHADADTTVEPASEKELEAIRYSAAAPKRSMVSATPTPDPEHLRHTGDNGQPGQNIGSEDIIAKTVETPPVP